VRIKENIKFQIKQGEVCLFKLQKRREKSLSCVILTKKSLKKKDMASERQLVMDYREFKKSLAEEVWPEVGDSLLCSLQVHITQSQ
jgi:hypothetical protein